MLSKFACLVALVFCVTGLMASYERFSKKFRSYDEPVVLSWPAPQGVVTSYGEIEQVGAHNVATVMTENAPRNDKK